jgi:hypothetical protein
MTFTVVGDTNDYCGKGLSGAKVIVRPPEDSPFQLTKISLRGMFAFMVQLPEKLTLLVLLEKDFAYGILESMPLLKGWEIMGVNI